MRIGVVGVVMGKEKIIQAHIFGLNGNIDKSGRSSVGVRAIRKVGVDVDQIAAMTFESEASLSEPVNGYATLLHFGLAHTVHMCPPSPTLGLST